MRKGVNNILVLINCTASWSKGYKR